MKKEVTYGTASAVHLKYVNLIQISSQVCLAGPLSEFDINDLIEPFKTIHHPVSLMTN